MVYQVFRASLLLNMEVLLNCYPASADRIQDEEAAISWTRSLVCQGQAGPLRQAAVLWDLNLWFLKIFHWRCWKFNLEPSASCFSYCLILSLQRSHAGIRHAQVQIPKLRKINACAGLLKYKNGPGSNFFVSCQLLEHLELLSTESDNPSLWVSIFHSDT